MLDRDRAADLRLICAFVFAYAKGRLPHDVAQMSMYIATCSCYTKSKFALEALFLRFKVMIDQDKVGLILRTSNKLIDF